LREPQQTARPFLVTAIGWFEIVRAGLILLIALSPLPGGTDLAANPAMQVATINLMSVEDFTHYDFAHEIDHNPHYSDTEINMAIKAALALPFAAPFVILGAGLLSKKRWARRYTAGVSICLALLWIRGLAIYWAFGNSDVSREGISIALRTIGLALLLNGFIFLYLSFGYGVAHAFDQKK
jgi:hypothetical protein